MSGLTRQSLVRMSMATLAAASAGLLLWSLAPTRMTASSREPAAVGQPDGPAPFRDFQMVGAQFRTYRQDRLLARLDVERLAVVPRRFGIFTVTPLTEVLLSNVHVYVYGEAEPGAGVPTLPLFGELGLLSFAGHPPEEAGPPLRGLTRGRIEGLVVELSDGGRPRVRLSGEGGVIDFRTRKIAIHRLTIRDTLSGRTLTAASGQWDYDAQVLKIPGDYVDEGPQGRRTGQGALVDLHFHVRLL